MRRRGFCSVLGGLVLSPCRDVDATSASGVRVLAGGNPFTSTVLLAPSNAPSVPADRWFAMTRLDQNRGESQLAKKAGVPVSEVTNMTIWGNHSATQYTDFANARSGGKPAPEVIADGEWLCGTFIETVQKRGAAVIEARGLSSAASAANAAIDSVNSARTATPSGAWSSLAVVSRGEYGTPEGLQYGFPVAADGNGGWTVVEGLTHDEFAQKKLAITTEELVAERDEVRALGLI